MSYVAVEVHPESPLPIPDVEPHLPRHPGLGPFLSGPFETNFSFIEEDNQMLSYLRETPEAGPTADDMPPSHPTSRLGGETEDHAHAHSTSTPYHAEGDVSMTQAEGDVSSLSIHNSPRNQQHPPPRHAGEEQEVHVLYQNIPTYQLGPQHPNMHPAYAQQMNHHFHPYQRYHGPMYMQTPISQLSPPLSLSPPGSSGTHTHYPLSPYSINPHLVSPHSGAESSLSDASPIQSGWHALPQHLPHYVTPFHTLQALPQTSPPDQDYSMMVPLHHTARTRGGRRAPSARVTRQSTSRAATKRVAKREPSEDSLQGSALGLTREGDEDSQQDKKPKVAEQVRKSRIVSEQILSARMTKLTRVDNSQRRRNDLRKQFDLLENVLPPARGGEKSSKTAILGRSAALILSLEQENSSLREALNAAHSDLRNYRIEHSNLLNMVTALQNERQTNAASVQTGQHG